MYNVGRKEVRMILKDGGERIADFSLKFFRKNRKKLGKVVKVEMQEYVDGQGKFRPYPFRIFDDKGNQLWLSGCATGYVGQGPYATYRILQELGLEIEHAMVRKAKSFTIAFC